MWTLDFETEAVPDHGPVLPRPVGLAVRYPSGRSEYYSWGHPFGNNSTFENVRDLLHTIWEEPVLTHNGLSFDIPIAQHYFGLPERDPNKTHDTLILAYLANPHARSLSLKDLANDLLGMPPDEQTEMNKWIIANVPECRTAKQAGAYIARAPAPMVAPYAIGDVTRTYALWQHLAPTYSAQHGAYLREIKLGKVLTTMQLTGVGVDVEALESAHRDSSKALDKLDAAVRFRLRNEHLNLDSPKEVAQALVAAGYSGFHQTEKGALSTNKASLASVLKDDPELQKILHSRATYSTLLGTFIEPWLRMADDNFGRIHARYNQVRNPDGFGTRTGRLSSSNPNFQNVPNKLGTDFYGNPFPEMRSFLLPDSDHVWTCGDFKSQEPRLTAHFEDGALCRAFNENPELDQYIWIAELCGISRKEAKTVFLGLVYAMGAGSLAEKLECSVARATELRNIIRSALPDVVALDTDCKNRFKFGQAIKTLGGRLYHCEPPSNGKSWEYKALNTLIQGSAADQTKEALVWADEELRKLDPSIRILTTVHDEYSVSHPRELQEEVYAIMRKSCNVLPCDVPMLMDIHTGRTWAEAGK